MFLLIVSVLAISCASSFRNCDRVAHCCLIVGEPKDCNRPGVRIAYTKTDGASVARRSHDLLELTDVSEHVGDKVVVHSGRSAVGRWRPYDYEPRVYSRLVLLATSHLLRLRHAAIV